MSTIHGLNAFQRTLNPLAIYPKPPRGWVAPRPPGDTVRILSWNLGRGHDPARLAAVLRAIDPDIACLQEVDWRNERTAGRDLLQDLADATSLHGLYGIEFFELSSPRRPRGLAGGGVTGNAILSRITPTRAFRVEMPPAFDWTHAAPGLPARARRALVREPRIGGRFGLAASFDFGGAPLLVCSVHLEDKAGGIAGRFRQFGAAVDACASTARAVIAGDLNTFDCSAARHWTRETDATALGKPRCIAEASWWASSLLPGTGFSDGLPPVGWTFRIPLLFRAKLDWILVRGAVMRGHSIGSAEGSDHRPIWLDLAL
jgi:endonuclease/exonuclease/phosphatase family metal-dependent hydrolase